MMPGTGTEEVAAHPQQAFGAPRGSTVSIESTRAIPVTSEPAAARKTRNRRVALARSRSENLDRLVNITLASIGLLLAAPIMLVFAALVKLTSPGPIFYTQARVGLDRRCARREAERLRPPDA